MPTSRATRVTSEAKPTTGVSSDETRSAFSDLGMRTVQLVDHDVDRVLQLEDLALDVGRDLLTQIAYAGVSARRAALRIGCEYAPFATAVVTSAMARTCSVRLAAMVFTSAWR